MFAADAFPWTFQRPVQLPYTQLLEFQVCPDPSAVVAAQLTESVLVKFNNVNFVIGREIGSQCLQIGIFSYKFSAAIAFRGIRRRRVLAIAVHLLTEALSRTQRCHALEL